MGTTQRRTTADAKYLYNPSRRPRTPTILDFSRFLSPDQHPTIPLYPLTLEAKTAHKGDYLPIRAFVWTGAQLVQQQGTLTAEALQTSFLEPIRHSIRTGNKMVPPDGTVAFQTGRMVFTALATYLANEIIQNQPYGLTQENLAELLIFWKEALTAKAQDQEALQDQLGHWFASMHMQVTDQFLYNFTTTIVNARQALQQIHAKLQIPEAEASHLIGISAETIALLILLTPENSPWRLNANPNGLLVSKPHADISQHTDFLLRRENQQPIHIDVTTGDIPKGQGILRVRIQPKGKDPKHWINAVEELFARASAHPARAFVV